ncbi:MAG TPA: HEAT repeat domain-containing protein [Flexivirga sp.]|uniref:HEAT repeat domain-containing protein n=1 Tax=Flexivirga sp. TaxID=1962927 RepID=UPI002BAF65D6|nr:HEAT repeat domain-containing protein [Flexivirga sp.]HWC24859.1 HEAT repeat domain-containing protein [Flexivirga sp.]
MGGTTPRARVTAAVARDGEHEFVMRCVALLGGATDPALVEATGGDSAAYVLAGHEGGPAGYWPRTWALRAFLYAWDPIAEASVVAASSDEHWRVREMAAKVIAARMTSSVDAPAALEQLAEDDNPRVRTAAERARAKFA